MPSNEKHERRLLASAARTATMTAAIPLVQGKGLILFVDVTARAVSTTVTPKLTMYVAGVTDGADIWTGAAIDSADTTLAYCFYPGAEDTDADYTEEVNMALPVNVLLTMTHSDDDSVTYSVHMVELP
jgi:hypothetical protein